MYPRVHPLAVHRYTDRHHAGRVLADHLAHLGSRHDAVILALPPGGVPVGFEVANMLRLPLDAWVGRTVGVQGRAGTVTRFERTESGRREREYRGIRPRVTIAGRIVILIDDNLATAAPMQAAVAAVRALSPLRVVIAAPVGAPEVCSQLLGIADEVICPLTPRRVGAAGAWYDDYRQPTDTDIRRLLDHAETPLSWSA